VRTEEIGLRIEWKTPYRLKIPHLFFLRVFAPSRGNKLGPEGRDEISHIRALAWAVNCRLIRGNFYLHSSNEVAIFRILVSS